MASTLIAQPLTTDEKKAAEAAFQRAPFNPAWSANALTIYNGIAEVMARRDAERACASQTELEMEREPEAALL